MGQMSPHFWNLGRTLGPYINNFVYFLFFIIELMYSVYLNTNRDAPETSHNILGRNDFTFSNVMPLVIQPGGLS